MTANLHPVGYEYHRQVGRSSANYQPVAPSEDPAWFIHTYQEYGDGVTYLWARPKPVAAAQPKEDWAARPDTAAERDFLLQTTKTVTLPACVAWFAQEMTRKLWANSHKGSWLPVPVLDLFERLKEETVELGPECVQPIDRAAILSEAADVANFAMMIATNGAGIPKGWYTDG